MISSFHILDFIKCLYTGACVFDYVCKSIWWNVNVVDKNWGHSADNHMVIIGCYDNCKNCIYLVRNWGSSDGNHMVRIVSYNNRR